MKKVLAFVLAAAMASLPLAGCGSSEKPAASSGAPASQAASTADSGTKSVEGKTVVFIPKLTGNAFFESANAGAQKYSKDWGFTVSYQGSPSAAVADQVQVVNNAIASGADAICISSVDATGLDSVLKKAKDAGITVATWDSDVSSDARTLMVSQGTPDILGKMLVDMGADSLTKRGKDVKKDAIKYCWHYSQATVADQNSWQVAGEAYIKENYPNWENVAPSNYYSEQDAEKAVSIGSSILEAHKDIDLIICNDSTALPGQLKAAQNKGLTKDKVTITGFASPNSIRDYAKANVIEQWGLWDCGIQGAMGCYLAAYLAAGNTVKVGDTIDIPNIGKVEVQPNDSLVAGAKTGDADNGVVLLPERVVFTTANVDNYNF
ncbi:substrate-binding domain-containing protein [Faecalispora jeddahensis]|uniref:substrate-binding domain-containing protein n=1 Tax=Faecalispora jeddahensis TaxID=1414721 RepID=UPI0028A9FB5F|nr:substrate-binding domain-containing protein [Faecalispora jeddahensis]